MKQKSKWTQNFPPKCGAVCGSCIQITHSIRFSVQEHNEAKIYMDFDPQCAAHASKITHSIRFLVQEHNGAKIYMDF